MAAMSNGFGMIHELAAMEKQLKSELMTIRQRVYTARQMLDDGEMSIDDLKRFLDDAMAGLKRLSGD